MPESPTAVCTSACTVCTAVPDGAADAAADSVSDSPPFPVVSALLRPLPVLPEPEPLEPAEAPFCRRVTATV